MTVEFPNGTETTQGIVAVLPAAVSWCSAVRRTTIAFSAPISGPLRTPPSASISEYSKGVADWFDT